MPSISASFSRDANHVPITNYGFTATTSLTTNANNTTANAPLFTVTGVVLVKALYGIVTTVLSSNQTAAFWQIDDQTATPDISLASGTTISSAAVGSMLLRLSVAGVALTLADAAAGRVTDPVAATAPDMFMPFIVTQKTGSITTTINFSYATTNAPATGAIQFFAQWLPLSSGATLVAV